MDIFEAIFTRRSIRRYTQSPVSEEHIRQILDAAMSAPSAGNAQPWDFIVIRDAARRAGIAARHPYAAMAAEAPVCIAVCADTSREKYPGFWPQDCSAAIQNMLLAARGLGLGTVWTGIYPVAERVSIFKDFLELPETVIPLAVVVLGHPDQPFAEKHRYDPARVRQEKW